MGIARQDTGESVVPLRSVQLPRLWLIPPREVGLVLDGSYDVSEMLARHQISTIALWAGRLLGWLCMGLSLGLWAAVTNSDVVHIVLCTCNVVTFKHEMDYEGWCWDIPELCVCSLNAGMCIALTFPMFLLAIALVWFCAWPPWGGMLLAVDAVFFIALRRLLAPAPSPRPFRKPMNPAYAYVEG